MAHFCEETMITPGRAGCCEPALVCCAKLPPGRAMIATTTASMPGSYVPPRGGLWLAVHDGTGVGCVALRPLDDDSAEVKRMFVDEAWRGRGVGR